MADAEAPKFFFRLRAGESEATHYFSEAAGLEPDTWTTVSLRRGVDSASELWRWRQQILDGEIAGSRRDVTIDVLDWTGAVVLGYVLARAWPTKYTSPGLNAGGEEILVEDLELTHEGIRAA